MHNHEILKMRAEFTKDDNGTIWFTFASRIHTREIIQNDERKVRTKKITYINKEHQALLVQQLKDHRAKARQTNNMNIEKIEAKMAEKYQVMKQNLGLDEALADSSECEEDAYIREKKRKTAIASRNSRLSKNSRSKNSAH
jgi:ethanolamine utilization protein EutA (predicted chaperonin)